MLNLNSIILFSDNPKQLVDFYKKVLQKDVEWSGGDFSGFMVGGSYMVIGPHDKVHGESKNPERIIFQFETPDVESEFNRIKDLGAKVVASPYHPGESEDMLLATLADPDGNYFQLGSPMKM